ncbi:MAG: methionyl-tRNA formyltransferase [Candidatus Dormibacteria bacterium]
MRVAFAGSAGFSVPSLRALAESEHEVVRVLTVPDGLGARGHAAPRPVRDLALELGLPVAQPPRLTASRVLELELDRAELLIVCAYGQLLPEGVLATFGRGAWGVHPSLLPRHRGASPIPSAILAGDETTGVTIYQMDLRMDAGPILMQAAIPVPPRTTSPKLSEELALVASELLLETLHQAEEGNLSPMPQDDLVASYCAKMSRGDSVTSWDMPAEKIDRLVRALQPWPGAVAELGGRQLKLLSGEAMAAPDGSAPPGTVIGTVGEAVVVATGAGAYLVQLVQPSSSRAMTPAAFLRGQRQSGRDLP